MRIFWAYLLFGLMPLQASGADMFEIGRLIQLQKSGQSAQAYQYALQYRADQEGDLEFDLYFGMAAIDSGALNEGVFALERVLMQSPDHYAARLELARGYFLLEEYERARAEFESILALDPPTEVQKNIDRYLDAIRQAEGRYKRTFSGFVALGAGSDDNVNSGPASAGITLPLFGIVGQLSPESVAQDDQYSELDAGIQWEVPMAPGWSFSTGLEYENHQNQEWDKFDTELLEARLGVNKLYKNSLFRLNFENQKFLVDGADYRTTQGTNIDWRLRIGSKSQVQTFVQRVKLKYDALTLRDSDINMFGVGYAREFAVKLSPVLFASAYAGDETPQRESLTTPLTRDLHGFSLGMQLNLPAGWSLSTTYNSQNSTYDGVYQIFQTARKDDYSLINLELGWKINPDWLLQVTWSGAKNNSNIELNHFERNLFGISLRYLFGS